MRKDGEGREEGKEKRDGDKGRVLNESGVLDVRGDEVEVGHKDGLR